jgi:hypothetical protein
MNFAKRIAWACSAAAVLAIPAHLAAQPPQTFGPASQQAAPPSAKAAAPFDITGYWVSIVTEDWRFRMITPGKGDYPGVPLNDAGKKIADAWDPAKDEAAGEQCRAYGAAGLMRIPTRLHITWQDDNTLKIETDAGTQTRLLHFTGTPSGNPSWQGYSAANWERLQGGNPFGPPKYGSLKVVTTRLRPGYLRKNGVPYSANTTVTEYIDLLNDPNSAGPTSPAETWLMFKTIVNDPTYLTEPFLTSTHFKKQPDGAGWNPTPCSAR